MRRRKQLPLVAMPMPMPMLCLALRSLNKALASGHADKVLACRGTNHQMVRHARHGPAKRWLKEENGVGCSRGGQCSNVAHRAPDGYHARKCTVAKSLSCSAGPTEYEWRWLPATARTVRALSNFPQILNKSLMSGAP